MSEKHCAFCKSILFDDDDIVVCPECGAPHHRDCYNELGHCAAEELHGTDKCYRCEADDCTADDNTSAEQQVCPSCGLKGPAGAVYCSYCGARYDGGRTTNTYVHYVGADLLGGVAPDEEIDGVKAEDIALYVRTNTARYVPLFKQLSHSKRKVHWNWSAFLFPQAWLLLRKNYFAGFISLAVGLISTFLCGPMTLLIQNVQLNAASSEYAALLEAAIQNADPLVHLLFLAGSLLSLVVSIVVGMFGDRIYKDNVIEKLQRINANDEIEDKKQEILRVGGLNLWLAALVLMFTI